MRRTGIATERFDVLVDVVDAPDHPAGPVLEIDVERDPVLRAVLDRPANVVDVLRVRLPQLLAAMVQRALRQQVDDPRPDRLRPVDRLIAVDKPQDLDSIGPALRVGVVDNGFHGAALALADAGRRHFDAIHLDRLEQSLRDGPLLLGHHRDAFGLLSIPKRRIHDLDTTGFPFAHIFRESIALTHEIPGRGPPRAARRCCIVQQRKNIRNAGPNPRHQPRQDGNSRQARRDSRPHGRHDDAVEGAAGEHARQSWPRRSDRDRDRRRQQPGGDHEDHQARHREARHPVAGRRREAGCQVLVPRRSGAESGVRQSGRARGGLQQHSRQSGDGCDVHLHEVPDPDVLSRDGSTVRRSAGTDQRQGPSKGRPPCCRSASIRRTTRPQC